MDELSIIDLMLFVIGGLVSFMMCLAGYDPGAIGKKIDSPFFCDLEE